jgi:hypothetical protein
MTYLARAAFVLVQIMTEGNPDSIVVHRKHEDVSTRGRLKAFMNRWSNPFFSRSFY